MLCRRYWLSLKGAKMNSRVCNAGLKELLYLVPERGEPQIGSFYVIHSPLSGTLDRGAIYSVGLLPTAIHLCPFQGLLCKTSYDLSIKNGVLGVVCYGFFRPLICLIVLSRVSYVIDKVILCVLLCKGKVFFLNGWFFFGFWVELFCFVDSSILEG